MGQPCRQCVYPTQTAAVRNWKMPGPRPTPNLPLSTQYMSFWSPLLGKAEGSKATLAGTPTALQLSLQLPGCRAAPLLWIPSSQIPRSCPWVSLLKVRDYASPQQLTRVTSKSLQGIPWLADI